jgi:general secretion pathway protein G
MKPRKAYKTRGFTLIEILIVMAIIAMLAALVAPSIMGAFGGSQRKVALSQMSSLATALDSYRLDVGRYPRELSGLLEDDDAGRDVWNGPYLQRTDVIPKDPWSNDYVYTLAGDEFELLSYGADGVKGGDGDDADIEL